MKRIYLIDCPGVVPPSMTTTDEDILLRGVVRVERVENPAQYIEAVLKKVRPRHVELTYEVSGYSNAHELLEMIARKRGRLLKGGEADLDGAAKMVLSDFIRGKLPWCTPPPAAEGEEAADAMEDVAGSEEEEEDNDDDESALEEDESEEQSDSEDTTA